MTESFKVCMHGLQKQVFPLGPKVAELRIAEELQSTAALEHYQHSTTNRAMTVRNAEQLPGTDVKLHPSLFILILFLEMSSFPLPPS